MEKALSLLKDFEESFKDATIVQEGELERNGIAWILYVRESISELEEAMKPKTCADCKHRSNLAENLTNTVNNGFCVENGFFTKHGFCCNRYETKDNA